MTLEKARQRVEQQRDCLGLRIALLELEYEFFAVDLHAQLTIANEPVACERNLTDLVQRHSH